MIGGDNAEQTGLMIDDVVQQLGTRSCMTHGKQPKLQSTHVQLQRRQHYMLFPCDVHSMFGDFQEPSKRSDHAA